METLKLHEQSFEIEMRDKLPSVGHVVLIRISQRVFSVFAARCYESAAYAIMRCVCVCVGMCARRSYILSKRIKISSKFFHRRVATPF